MRRALVIAAAAVFLVASGGAIADAAGNPKPRTVVRHHAMSEPGATLGEGQAGRPADLADDTRVIGVRWSGDPDARFTVETRDDDGHWHRDGGIGKPDGGADPGSADATRAERVLGGAFVSEPITVLHRDRVRIRVEQGTAASVDLTSVGSTTGTTGHDGPSVPAMPAMAASGLALGALVVPRRKGVAAALVVVIGASGALVALDVVHPPAAHAAGPGQPRIISRAEWGADESLRLGACPSGPESAIPRIAVVHHTDGANAYSPDESPSIVRGLYVWFIQSRGYCDMAYNFLIDKYGTIFEGRYGGIDQGVVGAHATGFNTGTFGVALMGSYGTVPPSGSSVESLISLLAWKMSVHRMNPYVAVAHGGGVVDPIIGHRDAGAISGDGTSCPGQALYDLLPAIRDRVRPMVDYGTPLGNLESAQRRPGAIQVSGWAIDPETPSSITVHAYVDGGWAGAFTASGSRPDVQASYYWLGAAHGYSFSVPVGFGNHRVCVYAINVGAGAENPLLGCATPVGVPVGNFESAAWSPGSVRLTGWAIDPDVTSAATVHVYVDGGWGGAYTASANRPDLAAAFTGYGPNHGFDTTVSIGAGNHQLCVYAINVGPTAPNPLLGCRTVSGTPTGNFESAARSPGSVRLTGWALDPDTANPATVHVYVDGGWGGAYAASGNRADIATAFPGYGPNHGFDTTVAVGAGNHLVCVYAINVGPAATNPLLGCRTVSGTPTGNFESVSRTGNAVRLTGWALDPDTANPATVHVYVDGGWGGAYAASGNRADIATAFPGYGPNHGFDTTVAVASGGHQVCVYAINVGPVAANPLLGCRSA